MSLKSIKNEKIVEFKRLNATRWNLSFGDVKDNDWIDNTISDNNDLRKVLQTIVNTVHLFFDKYPNQEVFIAPLDHQRKLLYNRIFQQKWLEIEPIYTVKAINVVNDTILIEDYKPKKLVDYFVIMRKTSNFEY